MITFLYGRSGSGKSTVVTQEIEERLSRGEQVILLCPEQEAVIAEARLTARLGGRCPTENLEILNFGRLPERVFRETGGLTVREIGEGGRRLLMHRALNETAPFLLEYGTAVKLGEGSAAMLDKLVAAVAECKMCCVTPADLEEAVTQLKRSGGSCGKLCNKLTDLSLVYTVYERCLHKEYRDPEDMLSYLDTVLDRTKGAFFAHKTIYLDGFNGFTAQQYRIIRRIFSYAENAVVSLGCDCEGEREWMFRRIYETEKNLFAILRDENRKAEIRSLNGNRRTHHAALLYLNRHLWQTGTGTRSDHLPPFANGDIHVFACDTPYAEAEAAALDIRRYVMAGGRWRDVTVITRGIERYEGILDAIFEKYEIPLYMARRSDVTSKPLFRYLRHLASIVTYGPGRQDVIGILKTGFSGVDEHDVFLFESYVNTWNLNGRAFTDDGDWNMHPAGYKEEITEDDLAYLESVNRVRRTLNDTLFAFCEAMRKPDESVTARAAMLYQYFRQSEIPEALDRRAQKERADGDLTDADETEQLWDSFVDALDTLVTVSGDTVTDAQTFFMLFDLLVSDLDIGTIPARCDEVTAGDAALIRPENAKRVYLIGCVDGAFPKTPEEDALLSDYDKTILQGLGISLSVGCAEQMQDEMFHFWFAAAAAEETLILTYPKADLQGKAFRPSSAVERICALFEDVSPENPLELPPLERMVNAATAFDCMAQIRRTPAGNALYDGFCALSAEDESIRRRLDALTQPLVQRRCRLNDETLSLLFGKTVAMTQSRLESYVLCHFAYFCGYVLKLREQKRVTFGTADIGTFVHYVLQGFMERYANDEHPEKYNDDTVLSETVGTLLDAYLSSYSGIFASSRKSMRVMHLIERLRQTATVIVRNLIHEFSQSDFRPRDFELP
ncbi:MAG: PD-(D/E)XK nuclease family protein, partial [Eubacteriales bacterium]